MCPGKKLTTTIPDQLERKTITVIQSPPRPASEDDSAGSTGPAEVADSARGDGSARPVDSAVVANLAGEWRLGKGGRPGSSGRPSQDCRLGKGCRPSRGWRLGKGGRPGSSGRPSQDCRLGKGCRPSRTERSSSCDSSRVADSSSTSTGSGAILWGQDGSVIFPSLPRRINQANLLDFMSMMTVMQVPRIQTDLQWREDSLTYHHQRTEPENLRPL